MSVLMIEVLDAQGNKWNLNLDYVVAVELVAPGPVTNQTQITNERVTLAGGKVVQLPPGTWSTAIGDLIAEFNTGLRRADEHIFIAGAP